MGLGMIGRAAYCDDEDVAGLLAGAEDGAVAEDDGAAGVITGFDAEDDELGKMLGAAALCEVLPEPSGATLTLVLPNPDGRCVDAGFSGFGILGTATDETAELCAAAEDEAAGAMIGDADGSVPGRVDRLLDGVGVWAPVTGAPGVEASGRSFSDGADEVLLEAEAADGVASGAAGSLEVSTWSITEPPRASRLPITVMPIELANSRQAKTQVSLVSRLPAPRADMKPEGPPPMPSAPPSERWMRIRPPITAQMRTWAVSRMPNNMRD